jgi:two-component system OmpR family response regulator
MPSRSPKRERGFKSGVRILLIEDDKDVASFIRTGLQQNGWNVDHTHSGKDGLFLATTETYDALVVDRMLPGVDGLTIIRTLRASGNRTPALILSALGEVDDRVAGLKAGGDDYLVKPFAFTELSARLEALLRRAGDSSAEHAPTQLTVADLKIDLLRREVRRGSTKIDLQPREFQLLEFLMRHAGQVVTRTMLLEGVWDYHFDPQTNVIDVHISRLRAKIDRDFDRPLLHTVRGAGYKLDPGGGDV